MKSFLHVATGLVVAAMLSGCTGGPTPPGQTPAQTEWTEQAIQAVGGLDAWEDIEQIQARAVVKVYDESGQAFVTEQTQTIGLWGVDRRRWGVLPGRAPYLMMTAPVAGGVWSGRVSLDGREQLDSTAGPIDPEIRQAHLRALKMLLYRLRGPLNLLDQPIDSVSQRRIEDDTYTRIATSYKGQSQSYYLRVDNDLLSMLTEGADQAGGPGTVTLYEYRRLSNGLVFPSRIRVMRLGDYVLIGQRPILEVEYLEVTMQ